MLVLNQLYTGKLSANHPIITNDSHNKTVVVDMRGIATAGMNLSIVHWNQKKKKWQKVSGKGIVDVGVEHAYSSKITDIASAQTCNPTIPITGNNMTLSEDDKVLLGNEKWKIRNDISRPTNDNKYLRGFRYGKYYYVQDTSLERGSDELYCNCIHGIAVTSDKIESNILPLIIQYDKQDETCKFKFQG
jgi:hypothetical protein